MKLKSVAKSESILRDRVKRFFSRARTYAPDLNVALNALHPLGEVLAFGGLVRNAALFDLDSFRSDIDLVVDVHDRDALDAALWIYQPIVNAFGGYRIRVNSFQVDIWPAHSTWAFQRGLVGFSEPTDLLKTTFFNWDAAMFSFATGTLATRENYIRDLRDHFLDVVLLENPNPIGIVRRTIRLMTMASARLSPKLATFLVNTVESAYEPFGNQGPRRFIAAEDATDLSRVASVLKNHLLVSPNEPFQPAPELEFLRHTRTQY